MHIGTPKIGVFAYGGRTVGDTSAFDWPDDRGILIRAPFVCHANGKNAFYLHYVLVDVIKNLYAP